MSSKGIFSGKKTFEWADKVSLTPAPLLTCFIVVGGQLVNHLTIHRQDLVFEHVSVVRVFSLVPLKGL